MSGIRDVVARMAADPGFAEHVRSHPDEVAQQYGLSPDEIDKIRGLAEAEPQKGPAPLGARLSKSGISGGLLAGFLATAAETTVDPTASAEGGDVSKAELFVFDPQPDPPGGPHVAEAALGGPDTQPVGDAADDGGIIIHYAPDPDAFDYGIPDTQPEPGFGTGNEKWLRAANSGFAPDDPDIQGIIINDMPDPGDAGYGVPDTLPSDAGPGNADAEGIIDDGDHPVADIEVQEIAITKVADAGAADDVAIIDDGDAPGLEPAKVEIKSSLKVPLPSASDPGGKLI